MDDDDILNGTNDTVECGRCETPVPVKATVERLDEFFGGTFRICNKCAAEDEHVPQVRDGLAKHEPDE